jgi:hypothetical protein
MIIIANHNDGFYYKRGIRVNVIRGQIGYDLDSLGKRWKWSRGKVDRFINELENDKQIVRQKNNITTLITVINYETYQSDSKAKSKADSKADGHQTVKQTEANKNNKNDNNNTLEGKIKINQDKLKEEMKPYIDKYTKDMLNDFYRYWAEANLKTGKCKYQMMDTWETSKRLITWNSRNLKETK